MSKDVNCTLMFGVLFFIIPSTFALEYVFIMSLKPMFSFCGFPVFTLEIENYIVILPIQTINYLLKVIKKGEKLNTKPTNKINNKIKQ